METTSNFEWVTPQTEATLRGGYLLGDETAVSRVRDVAYHSDLVLAGMMQEKGNAYSSAPTYVREFREKFFKYMGLGFYSLASPIWANYGRARGLPISCFGSHVSDTLDSILSTAREIGMMSKYGGGTAAYFGDVRGRGKPITDNGFSEGSVHFMQLFDTIQNVTRQGSTRRGSTAVYLPIDHGDILEFLNIREPKNPIQQLSYAVTIPEGWMQAMLDGDKDKQRLWLRVMQRRGESGMPYIFFEDNANDETSPYHGSEYRVRHSQLCAEIMLPTSEEESFVCCLSSMNMAKYDEWKDTDAVEVLTVFLDTVIEEFLAAGSSIPGLERAVRFAERHRAIGIGILGFHTYLQENMIPFGSILANTLSKQASQAIQAKSYAASTELGRILGVPAVANQLGLNRRNTTTTAIAPTQSSSYILGQVSQSIEPLLSNHFIKGLAKTTEVFRNPTLTKVLQTYSKDTPEVWQDILHNDGSVQHLDFLTPLEKDVFKTAGEISQLDIVVMAADRQQYIDQGQSLNLFIHPSATVKDISDLHIEGWKRGLKTFYYQHSNSAAQAFNRDLLICSACSA